MAGDEAEVFEKDALFETSIRMRKWDELAKEVHVPVLDLEQMRSKALGVLNGNQ